MGVFHRLHLLGGHGAALCDLVDGLTLALGFRVLVDDEHVRGAERGRDTAVEQTMDVMRRRLEQTSLGVTGMRRVGDMVWVEIGEVEAEGVGRLKEMLGRQSRLEFRLVDDSESGSRELAERLPEFCRAHPGRSASLTGYHGHGGLRVKASSRRDLEAYLDWFARRGYVGRGRFHAIQEKQEYGSSRQSAVFYEAVCVHDAVWLSNVDVSFAAVIYNMQNEPVVSVQFTPDGAARFATLTEQHVDRGLAILLDGDVVSAPIIRERITGGRAQITLGSTTSPMERFREAERLAQDLNAGGYHAAVELAEELVLPGSGLRTGVARLLCSLPRLPQLWWGWRPPWRLHPTFGPSADK